jgi:DNA-binding CsgD family transcriptional regulator
MPLFNCFGITHFTYVKIYNDGSRCSLSTNAEWTESFFKNKFYMLASHETDINKFKSGYLLWLAANETDQKVISFSREFHNIDNGITIIERQASSCDFYHFGSTRDNYKIINFYINNIDLLNKFILYFKDKASKLITEAKNNKIILPDIKKPFYNKVLSKFKDENSANFLEMCKINRIFFEDNGLLQYLTKREFDCLLDLIQGKTAKEIARKLNISSKTVEYYLGKVKIKLGCYTRAQLIHKALEKKLQNL